MTGSQVSAGEAGDAGDSALEDRLRLLGEALNARTSDVVERMMRALGILERGARQGGRRELRAGRRGLHGRRRQVDGGRGGGGRSRGRAGVLADLRPARLPARGAAERGDQTLPALARLRGGGAALQRRRAGARRGCAEPGAANAAAKPRRHPRADVPVLRGRAPALARGTDQPAAGTGLPGYARRPHRAAEPDADPRPHRADADAGAAQAGTGGGAVRGPRQLQGDQRLARPQRRRRAALRGRRPARRRHPRDRRARPARRGRVRGDRRRPLARRRARADRRAPARSLQGAVQAQGGRGHAGLRQGEHRHRHRRAILRRGAAARRRHRHVQGQVGRQEPLPRVRVRHAGRSPDPDGDRDGPAMRARKRGVLPRLPADLRPAEHVADGGRGADSLAAAGARSRPARGIHPAAGGDRDDRRRRRLGPQGGLRPGRQVAAGRLSHQPGGQRLRAAARHRRPPRPRGRGARARAGSTQAC